MNQDKYTYFEMLSFESKTEETVYRPNHIRLNPTIGAHASSRDNSVYVKATLSWNSQDCCPRTSQYSM